MERDREMKRYERDGEIWRMERDERYGERWRDMEIYGEMERDER